MKQVKILHCADVHLGADLTVLGRKATIRRAEIKKTFMNIIKLCQDEQIQLLLVAGDLFDNVHIQENMLEDLRDAFLSLKNTFVAIAPGNHDPLTEDSPYMKDDFWPKNVIIFNSVLEKIEIESLGVRLWGAAFKGTYAINPILNNFSVSNDQFINICVIHGDLVANNQKSNYNPITEMQLAKSNMDYVALGHIHKRSEILKAGDTYYAYPGCPEGSGFDELDEKGVFVGFVSKGLCKLEHVKICQRMNVELHVDISIASNSKLAGEIIIDKMKSKYGNTYQDNLYKVILEGTIADNINIDIDEVKAAINEVFFVKIKDQTTVKFDFEAASTETTLKSVFIRKMLERINDTNSKDKDNLNTALKLGLKAFIGEVKYSED